MNLVNLTPHPLRLRKADGTFMDLPKPAAGVAIPRRSVKTEQQGEIDGLPVYKTVLGPVENAPAPQQDTVFVVSRLVVDAMPERTDLVSPGEAIRDADGKVIGANGVAR